MNRLVRCKPAPFEPDHQNLAMNPSISTLPDVSLGDWNVAASSGIGGRRCAATLELHDMGAATVEVLRTLSLSTYANNRGAAH